MAKINIESLNQKIKEYIYFNWEKVFPKRFIAKDKEYNLNDLEVTSLQKEKGFFQQRVYQLLNCNCFFYYNDSLDESKTSELKDFYKAYLNFLAKIEFENELLKVSIADHHFNCNDFNFEGTIKINFENFKYGEKNKFIHKYENKFFRIKEKNINIMTKTNLIEDSIQLVIEINNFKIKKQQIIKEGLVNV